MNPTAAQGNENKCHTHTHTQEELNLIQSRRIAPHRRLRRALLTQCNADAMLMPSCSFIPSWPIEEIIHAARIKKNSSKRSAHRFFFRVLFRFCVFTRTWTLITRLCTLLYTFFLLCCFLISQWSWRNHFFFLSLISTPALVCYLNYVIYPEIRRRRRQRISLKFHPVSALSVRKSLIIFYYYYCILPFEKGRLSAIGSFTVYSELKEFENDRSIIQRIRPNDFLWKLLETEKCSKQEIEFNPRGTERFLCELFNGRKKKIETQNRHASICIFRIVSFIGRTGISFGVIFFYRRRRQQQQQQQQVCTALQLLQCRTLFDYQF